jgi:hypothetical protein
VGNCYVKQTVQKGTAPTAPGAGAKTFCQLAGARRTFHADKVRHFPLGYMKAEAKFVVGLHNYQGW